MDKHDEGAMDYAFASSLRSKNPESSNKKLESSVTSTDTAFGSEGLCEPETAVLPKAIPPALKSTTSGISEAPQKKRSRKKKAASRLADDVPFDPRAPEFATTWSSHAQLVCCVNSYPNGVTVSLHNNLEQPKDGEETASETQVKEGKFISKKFTPSQFHLRFKETRDYQMPRGKYFLYRDEYQQNLERHLAAIHKKGLLSSTVVYFGTTVDPFLSFHKRFDVTSSCLRLFEQYTPHKVVVQTRSPMIIAGLPSLKALEDKAVVVIPIETHLERSVARYTPGLPKISERLVAAQGLRRQGVMVNLAVSPILPYGDFSRDSWDFAEILDRHADNISLGCLASGNQVDEKQLKQLPIARKLASDKQYHWLRPHAYSALHNALSVVAPDKLRLPLSPPSKPSQMTLFAA